MSPSDVGTLVAVTGATGHLGNVLVRALVSRKTRVRALAPPGEDLAPLSTLPVECVTADLRDFDSLLAALTGADLVFHLGGIVSISTGMRSALWEVNVEGTKKVARACRNLGVRRLVYTSSVHAFVEPPPGQCLTEETQVDPNFVRGDYAVSKAAATLALRDEVARGLDVVTCYPSGVIGPYDYKPSEMGQLILEVAHGTLKAYIDGAYNFVDVRDVVEGLLAAAERGRSGEGYILSGHIISVRDFLSLTAEMTGTQPPRARIPTRLARAVGVLAPYYYRVVGQKPLFTSYSVDVLQSNCDMPPTKAGRELGFTARPLRTTLEDTVRWFRQAALI